MARFQIVVGTSTKSPQLAARDAERKARRLGGEQISIAADVLGGGGAADTKVLENIARNIYQLVQCTCPTLIGEKILHPGVPPPIPAGGSPGGQLWVVYILVKR